jgi:TonB family protein
VSHLTPGKLIKRVDPVYPSVGRAFGLQGKVVLDARIGKDGRVQEVRVVQGPAALRRAAADAVRQWVYQPWLLNGEPQELHTTVVVRFTQPR